jgi:KUP system potassium uptake protein
MTSSHGRTPVALLHSLKHYQAIHERVVFVTLTVEDEPHLPASGRVHIERLGERFWRVTGRYGYMEKPGVPQLLRECGSHGLEVDPQQATFFLGREIIVPSRKPGMARWRERVFSTMSRLAEQPATYFQIPVGRVIELGQQVEI